MMFILAVLSASVLKLNTIQYIFPGCCSSMSKSAIGTSKTIYEIRSTLNACRSDGAK